MTGRSHTGRVWTGSAGRATEVIIDEPSSLESSATVACWFLRCPLQSPAWDCYVLSVVHLRPIEGSKNQPVIEVPHASHQLMLYALERGRVGSSVAREHADPSPDDIGTWRMLVPINVCQQFEVESDHRAGLLAEMAARAVSAGVLWAEPPLSGQVEPWLTTIIQTSAHLRGEEHAL